MKAHKNHSMELMESSENRKESRQILVFRSNIDNGRKAKTACRELANLEGVHRANVDLEDWENVLRVVCRSGIQAGDIVHCIAQLGFECSELED